MNNDDKSKSIDKLKNFQKLILIVDVLIIVTAILTLANENEIYIIILIFLVALYLILKSKITKIEKTFQVNVKKEEKNKKKK